MIYFTSDTHFGHKNIITFCNRPYSSTNEMDEELISGWNASVKQDDIIYHLGDVAFAKAPRIQEIIGRLNGQKYLIRGNHDKLSNTKFEEFGFIEVHKSLTLALEDVKVTLEHIPKLDIRGVQLCGHVHNDWWIKNNPWGMNINVGVDQWDYLPVSSTTILEIIKHNGL